MVWTVGLSGTSATLEDCPSAAATQAESHGWVGSRGRPWVAASQTPSTHHASFPRAKIIRPALNLLGQDGLCQEALSPLKMPKGAARAHPDLQNSGRRWAWKQRPDFRHNGFSPALLVAEPRRGRPGQPPELCLRTPGLRDPRLGGASACGQGPARQGGVAPPLSALPPAPRSAPRGGEAAPPAGATRERAAPVARGGDWVPARFSTPT